MLKEKYGDGVNYRSMFSFIALSVGGAEGWGEGNFLSVTAGHRVVA